MEALPSPPPCRQLREIGLVLGMCRGVCLWSRPTTPTSRVGPTSVKPQCARPGNRGGDCPANSGRCFGRSPFRVWGATLSHLTLSRAAAGNASGLSWVLPAPDSTPDSPEFDRAQMLDGTPLLMAPRRAPQRCGGKSPRPVSASCIKSARRTNSPIPLASPPKRVGCFKSAALNRLR